jgi:hypothetical protein
MGMGVYETGQHYLASAIDLEDSPKLLLELLIVKYVSGLADEDNLATLAKNCGIFKNAELFEIPTSTGASMLVRFAQSKKLAYVDQQ